MGTKMSEAYYTEENKVIKINYANKAMNGSLKCKTEKCRVPVIFVDAHKKKYADKTVVVNAYFRLESSEKNSHDIDCKYNTKGQVKVIARESDDSIIKAIEEGKYNFRLNIIDEALRALNSSKKDEIENEETSYALKRPSKVYVNKGKLNSYFSTMQRIMELRSLTETNDELRELIELQYDKQKIKWSKFYFESDDLSRCYTYIKRNDVTHPMCIEGALKGIVPPNENFKFHVLKLRSPWVEPDGSGVINLPTVELIINNNKVLEYIQSNASLGNVAVYSKFRINESKIYVKQVQNGMEKFRYLNIKGNLYHPKQILLY
ncbi:hypothetical protein [Paenibacillus sp. FSL M7-0896]|uniref:hypothetical protein n=1 Tax=Paenibacillus sp. FSL M7-0896 TaxID=2921610 RepID=UPI0030DA24CD